MANRVRPAGTGLRSGPNDFSTSTTLDALIPSVREKRVQKILHSMASRLPNSVRELAEEVHLTPAHLQRLFKHETGAHIRDVLCECRLTVASNLLLTTDLEIKEIAYHVGYGHHSSFVRAFQRHFGQAPKTYRQNFAA